MTTRVLAVGRIDSILGDGIRVKSLWWEEDGVTWASVEVIPEETEEMHS